VELSGGGAGLDDIVESGESIIGQAGFRAAKMV
jgi:hypothetical protein